MKLEQSLAVYGLVDRPLPDACVAGAKLLDYADWRAIDSQDPACQARVAQVITLLNRAILGEDVVSLAIIRAPLHQGPIDGGLQFKQGEYLRTYTWEYTLEEMRTWRWTCGMVEAAYRRFLTGRVHEFPARLRARIPARLADWPA